METKSDVLYTTGERHSGFVPFRGYQTWYTVAGSLSDCQVPPLVVLHGGPAAGHDYLATLDELHRIAEIPVVLYDQVGCGKSTHLPNEPPETFTIDFFLEELDNLLAALKIDHYDLFGHSWGGMLACEHAAKKHPGLKRLILAGCPASTELALQVANEFYKQLPPKYYQAVLQHEDDGKETDDFNEANRLFMITHVCRLEPVPDSIMLGLQNIFEARAVNDALWGTQSSLRCLGSLKDWSIIERRHLIQNTTLITTGKYDYCGGGTAVEPFMDGSMQAQLVTFEESGHMPHLDDKERYLECVARFLTT